MKKVIFLLLMVIAFAGFVSAGDISSPIEAAGFFTETPGNITGFFNVTPGTVLTIPLYAESFIDLEKLKLIAMVKVGQNNFAVQEHSSSLKKDGALIYRSKPLWNQIMKT